MGPYCHFAVSRLSTVPCYSRFRHAILFVHLSDSLPSGCGFRCTTHISFMVGFFRTTLRLSSDLSILLHTRPVYIFIGMKYIHTTQLWVYEPFPFEIEDKQGRRIEDIMRTTIPSYEDPLQASR